MSKLPAFNVSRFKTFGMCERLYEHTYIDNLVSKEGEEDDTTLVFGTAIHAGLAAWYLNEFDVEAMVEGYKESLGKGYRTDDEFEREDYGELLLRKYDRTYREVDSESIEEVRMVEEESVVEVKELGIRLATRMDMLARFKGVGAGWYHVQHKTLSSSRQIGPYANGYLIDWHEPGYMLAMKKVLGKEEKLVGTMLNVLRKMSPGEKIKGENSRWEGEVWNGRKVMAEWNPFYRQKMTVGKKEIQLFTQDLDALLEWMWKCEQKGFFPRRINSCTAWNRTCRFFGSCRGLNVSADSFGTREVDYVDELNGRKKK